MLITFQVSFFFCNPACGFPKCKCNVILARKNVFTFSGLKELLFCYWMEWVFYSIWLFHRGTGKKYFHILETPDDCVGSWIHICRSFEEIALGVWIFRIGGVWLQVQGNAHFHFDVLFFSKMMWVVGSLVFLPMTFICFRLDLWFQWALLKISSFLLISLTRLCGLFLQRPELQHFSKEKLCCLIFPFETVPQWPWTLLVCLPSCLLRIWFLRMVVKILKRSIILVGSEICHGYWWTYMNKNSQHIPVIHLSSGYVFRKINI